MRRMRLGMVWVVALVLGAAGVAGIALGQQQNSIVNTPHNLSVTGPGRIHAVSEGQICIFCHTPHNAAPVQPLWNRNVPVAAYTPYSSSTLQAQPGQPTGSSKLCLSCHDGTIAIGSVLSQAQPIALSGGVTTLPPGPTLLGTNLSGDHPISFPYNTALVTRNPKLRDPGLLPAGIRLDRRQELQCTSCHDAHDDSRGNFLVMDNSTSQLCTSCHNMGATDVLNHQQCASCHQPHTAPSGPFLLHRTTITDTCTVGCHDGSAGATAGANILADLLKVGRHDTALTTPINPLDHAPNGIVCSDCHEPHTMNSGTVSAPTIAPLLGRINGINSAGAVVPTAGFQYEVCFKCHSSPAATQVHPITRQILQTDKRLQFAPSAISYHPVAVSGKNPNVPSLNPGLTTATLIYCSDCHGSDTSLKAGGTGPNGPHGSNLVPLLVAPYVTADLTPESATTYALCYRCHSRSSILSNESFSLHSLHIVGNPQTPSPRPAPCSVCHDSHGISSAQGTAVNNAHLINFDTTVVFPDTVSGKLEYQSTGVNAGVCFLSCHGVNHPGLAYPVASGAVKALGAQRARGPVRHVQPGMPPRTVVPTPVKPTPPVRKR